MDRARSVSCEAVSRAWVQFQVCPEPWHLVDPCFHLMKRNNRVPALSALGLLLRVARRGATSCHHADDQAAMMQSKHS